MFFVKICICWLAIWVCIEQWAFFHWHGHHFIGFRRVTDELSNMTHVTRKQTLGSLWLSYQKYRLFRIWLCWHHRLSGFPPDFWNQIPIFPEFSRISQHWCEAESHRISRIKIPDFSRIFQDFSALMWSRKDPSPTKKTWFLFLNVASIPPLTATLSSPTIRQNSHTAP